jgi:hypothetical protein
MGAPRLQAEASEDRSLKAAAIAICWGVDILWLDGETEVIKGFITEHDAAKWITEHSRALQGNTNDKSPQAP